MRWISFINNNKLYVNVTSCGWICFWAQANVTSSIKFIQMKTFWSSQWNRVLQIDIEIYYTIVICHHSPIVVHLWCHLNGTFLRIMNGSNFIIIQMIKFILISWVMSLIGPLLDLSGIYTIVVTCILIRLPTEHISFVVWWQFIFDIHITSSILN